MYSVVAQIKSSILKTALYFGNTVEIANDLADSACNRILEDLGGDCHYLPKKDTYSRNRQIAAEYNGKNEKELCDKYQLSKSTIKRIIHA